jgi:hypothetical protein
MRAHQIILAAAAAMLLFPVASRAHEVPNIPHTHAFQQTGYGTYRQGHTVNNQYGSITIWSPRPYTGYQSGNTVKFARPEPITRAPGSPVAKTRVQADPAIQYGKRQ